MSHIKQRFQRLFILISTVALSLLLGWLVWPQTHLIHAANSQQHSGQAETKTTSSDLYKQSILTVDCADPIWSVATSHEWNEAVSCFNAEVTIARYVISFTADIVLTDTTTSIDNATGASLYVEGNGHSLDGNDSYRVLRMDNGLTTIDSLTVTNGYRSSGTGAGIYVNGGTFTVTHSRVVSNSAYSHGGGIYVKSGGDTLIVQHSEIAYNETRVATSHRGGGIYLADDGVARIEDSTIHDNSTRDDGGGIYTKGSVYIENSIIYDNFSSNDGAGIFNNSGDLHLINSTISGNRGASGDAIYSSNESGGIVTLYLTYTTVISNHTQNIVINNSSSGAKSYLYLNSSIVAGSDENCKKGFLGTTSVTASYSLDSDGSCVTDGVDGNITDSDPMVGTLQDNGGETLTHALLANSPAVNQIPTGTNGCGTVYVTDQRGELRPFNLSCDMGSFEMDSCASSPFGKRCEL